ncbi:uncharacterized protein METZ01_LOCUS191143, partial [marine metagenome]
GSLQGGPLGRLHVPLGGQERRGRRIGRPDGASASLRHRASASHQHHGRHLRHRSMPGRGNRKGREGGLRLQARRDRRATRPSPSHLPFHDSLRSLRQARSPVGANRQGGRPQGRLEL